MFGMSRNYHGFTLHLHHETYEGDELRGALKVSETGDDKKAFWVPKSQLKERRDIKTNQVFVSMPEWLALEKGLI